MEVSKQNSKGGEQLRTVNRDNAKAGFQSKFCKLENLGTCSKTELNLRSSVRIKAVFKHRKFQWAYTTKLEGGAFR